MKGFSLEVEVPPRSVEAPSVHHDPPTLTPLRALAAAVLLGATALCAGLGLLPLTEPDEGRYADIARGFLTGGDWVVPHVNGISFHDKPPLVMWLTAASFELMGYTRVAARLVPVAFGLLGVIVAAWQAVAIGGRRAGWLAALALVTSPLWLAISRTLVLDVPVSALMAAGFALIARGAGALGPGRSLALRLAGGALVGLAVLTKGPVAPALVGLACVSLALLERDRVLAARLLDPRQWLVTVAIAAPWTLAFGARRPDGLWAFLVHENLARFLHSDEHQQHPLRVPGAVAWGLAPGLFLLACAWAGRDAGWSGCASRLRARLAAPGPLGRPERALGVFAAVVICFFTCSSSRIETYVLPAFPALAALIGVGLDRALGSAPGRARLRRGLAALLVPVLLLPAGWVVFGWLGPHLRREEARLAAEAARCAAALALPAFLVGVVAGVALRRRRTASALGLTGAALVLGALSALPPLSLALGRRSAETVAAGISLHRRPGQPVVVLSSYLRGLPFYLGEPTILAMNDGEYPAEVFRQERPDLHLPGTVELQQFLASRGALVVVPGGARGWRASLLSRLASAAGVEATLVGEFGVYGLFEVAPREADR